MAVSKLNVKVLWVILCLRRLTSSAWLFSEPARLGNSSHLIRGGAPRRMTPRTIQLPLDGAFRPENLPIALMSSVKASHSAIRPLIISRLTG